MSDFATVAVDGYTVTSTDESAESMISSLTPPKDEPAEPREVKSDSKAKDEPEDNTEAEARVSKAAADLGKKGGEATAAKRAVEAKETAKAEKEAAVEAEKDAEAEKLGKPRHDAKARMLEATREAAELKRELERERAERVRERAETEQLRAGKTAPAEAKPTPKPADGKPTSEQYDTYEAYLDARDEWNDRQRETRDAERERFTARDQGIKTAVQTFQGLMQKTAEADATFKERTADLATSLQPSFTLAQGQSVGPLNVAADEIISSEQAPALMLHFAEHPEDLQRLGALRTPLDVQMAIAKLEGRLGAASTASAPRAEVSKARPPIRPVIGSPYAADAAPGDDASYDEHARFYNAKEARRR